MNETRSAKSAEWEAERKKAKETVRRAEERKRKKEKAILNKLRGIFQEVAAVLKTRCEDMATAKESKVKMPSGSVALRAVYNDCYIEIYLDKKRGLRWRITPPDDAGPLERIIWGKVGRAYHCRYRGCISPDVKRIEIKSSDIEGFFVAADAYKRLLKGARLDLLNYVDSELESVGETEVEA